MLDVSALGIKTLADLVLTQQFDDVHISAKAQASLFEIVLTGTRTEQVLQENFHFA